MRSYRSFLFATVAVLAMMSAGAVRAAIVTQIVEFVAPTGTSQNQLAVAGTLNTLSQALGVVDFGNTSVNVTGLLRAQLTLDVPEQGEIELLGFEFLDSSFTQSGVDLFYDVPNTTRRVTFSATGLQFGLQFGGQNNNNNQQLLTAGTGIPSNAYQMVQNAGMAQVGITNRPPVAQNLSQQSVLSTYQGNQPIGQTSFAILPPTSGNDQAMIELTVPLSSQQMHYAGVGLPVTLSYTGTLNLVGSLPLIGNQIPEPGTLLMVAASFVMLSCRRTR